MDFILFLEVFRYNIPCPRGGSHELLEIDDMELAECHINIPPVYDWKMVSSLLGQKFIPQSTQEVVEELYFYEGKPDMKTILSGLEIPGEYIVLIFTGISAGVVYCRFINEKGEEIHPPGKRIGAFTLFNLEKKLNSVENQAAVLPELSGLTFEEVREVVMEQSAFFLSYSGSADDIGLNA